MRLANLSLQMKRCIFPAGIKPLAPYSPGVYVESTKTLYISGQLGFDPKDGKVLAKTVAEQTDEALKNVGKVLAEVGLNFDNLVSVEVLLNDMADFAAMNEIYAKYFPSNPPSRAAFAVKQLPLDAKVEIKGVAVKFD